MLSNLIPAFPMDGEWVLRALLAYWIDYARPSQPTPPGRLPANVPPSNPWARGAA